ncbi:MAG: hypothetical protein ACI8QS_002626 [Planctomycetota bacterium]|jgi:hypothetical protein
MDLLRSGAAGVRFELALPGDASDPEHLDWNSMLPTEDAVGWLRLDFPNRILVMSPSLAPQDPANHGEA